MQEKLVVIDYEFDYLNDCFGFVIIVFYEINDNDEIYWIEIKWYSNYYSNIKYNMFDFDVKFVIINCNINE